MSALLRIRNDDGDLETVDNFPREGWTINEGAEEGNSEGSTITIPDPDMVYNFIGWRRFQLYETDSEADNTVLASGFVADHEIGREGGEFIEPLGRVWSLSLVDLNNLWDRRLLIGTDTKRDAETDVERMTWMIATEEMGYFDDTTYLSTSDPVNLDKRDVARQSTKQVVDECAQQSGKNYWIQADIDGINVWYGHGSLEDYESPLRLSNDPADWIEDELADGTSLVWPISFDAKLKRDPNRVYDGVSVEYEKGAVYRKRAATTDFFTLSGRDVSHPAPEIKTATKARARGDRVLADSSTMDERLTLSVEVPAGKATMIRAGMRIAVRATHLPGWEDFGWARILTCSITPVHAGTAYRLGLVLQGPTSFVSAPEDDVTLIATNEALAQRNAFDAAEGLTFTSGQVWRYTITNTMHDPIEYTSSLALSWNTTTPSGPPNVVRAWGISVEYAGVVGTPTPAPIESYEATRDVLPVETGTFVITADGIGRFQWYCEGNYAPFPDPGPEQWVCALERLS